MRTEEYKIMTINQFADYTSKTYNYSNRLGNLTVEAVGVIKWEKHFPVFADRIIFKPLTKSKPLSTPLFAYAEVFWSNVINEYFVSAPLYQLAFCHGYEEETQKYYDYGTVVPRIYNEDEQLLNLLEFFRKYPDEKVDIDQYENYCMMFYDYADILEASYFQTHKDMAEQLAMQILVSMLKGDQNYHYENIAFVCNKEGEILRLAPMIDHEFSTYFMFPDNSAQHMYWYSELIRSMEGPEVQDYEYDCLKNPKERQMMEKSAVCLHKNLVYIKEHYPEVTGKFLEKLNCLKHDLEENPSPFYLQENIEYPGTANSYAYMSGKARYKDHDEEKAKFLEEKYSSREKKIDFHVLSVQIVQEIKGIIRLLKVMLEKENGNWDKVKEQNDEDKAGAGGRRGGALHLPSGLGRKRPLADCHGAGDDGGAEPLGLSNQQGDQQGRLQKHAGAYQVEPYHRQEDPHLAGILRRCDQLQDLFQVLQNETPD